MAVSRWDHNGYAPAFYFPEPFPMVENLSVRRTVRVVSVTDQLNVAAADRRTITCREEYGKGKIDYDRVFILEANQVRLQSEQVRAQADVAIGLIRVYKALGGGWQIRLGGCAPQEIVPVGEEMMPGDGTARPQGGDTLPGAEKNLHQEGEPLPTPLPTTYESLSS